MKQSVLAPDSSVCANIEWESATESMLLLKEEEVGEEEEGEGKFRDEVGTVGFEKYRHIF